jgi:hypothetical protein
MKPLFILVGGDKGGTGKTTVTRVLLDYLDANSVPARVFDSEYPGGDLRRFRDNVHIVDLMRLQDQMKIFDDTSGNMVTVVDIRAGMLSEILRALDEAEILEKVREGSINMAVLHVLGASAASLDEVGSSSKLIGNATHFLVKNHIDDTGLGELANDPRYVELLQRMQPLTINVPRIKEPAGSMIQTMAVGFATFVQSAPSGILRGVVKSWIKNVSAEFDRVGLTELIKRTLAN